MFLHPCSIAIDLPVKSQPTNDFMVKAPVSTLALSVINAQWIPLVTEKPHQVRQRTLHILSSREYPLGKSIDKIHQNPHTPASPTNPPPMAPPTLSTLPRELRDQIYAYLLPVSAPSLPLTLKSHLLSAETTPPDRYPPYLHLSLNRPPPLTPSSPHIRRARADIHVALEPPRRRL